MANTSKLTTCVALNNQQCMTDSTLINLSPNEYIHGLRCYSFPGNLDRCSGSCSKLDDQSSKICLLRKTEDISLSVFNIITRKNE